MKIIKKVKSLIIFPLILLIKLYQKIISPMLGMNKCKFSPTCSSYAILALKEHGLIIGLFLSIYRILRCNPWTKGGYDPVPHNMRKIKWVI